MSRIAPTIAAVLTASMTAACSHTVPALVKGKAGYDSRPTVEAVVDHLACELRAADVATGGKLVSDKYLVSVTLLLQVDDAFGTTPNASYTEGLKPPDTSLVTQLGLGLNGERLRTFTTTYTIDATDLAKSTEPKCASLVEERERLYTLQGNLRLEEIVKSGLAARDQEGGIVKLPKEKGDKAAPTFGSQVQFIVTESLSAFGPTWTLRYWKGPSGANGLFNGKRVYKNSVTLAFAPSRVPDKPSEATQAAAASVAVAEKQRADALSNLGRLQPESFLPGQKMTPQLQGQLALNRFLAQQALDAREADLARARAVLAAAQASDQRAAADGARDAAVASSRDLLTTMLLQNLPAR